MGFRSTFTTNDYGSIKWPEWFFDKYKDSVNFSFEKNGVLSSKFQIKTYYGFEEFPKDIQRVLIESNSIIDNFILLYLHECGGITRVQIEKENIFFSEPDDWNNVEEIRHDYCYGCSDVKSI